MKHKQFQELIQCKVINGVFYPLNDNGKSFALVNDKEEVYLIPQTQRDLALHGVYFLFCGWIWEQLPTKFKLERCPNKCDMYDYLKLIQGNFEPRMQYKDIKCIKLESISFGNMSNDKFKDFVNEQIIALYENILIPLGREDLYELANEEFKSLFRKLI